VWLVSLMKMWIHYCFVVCKLQGNLMALTKCWSFLSFEIWRHWKNSDISFFVLVRMESVSVHNEKYVIVRISSQNYFTFFVCFAGSLLSSQIYLFCWEESYMFEHINLLMCLNSKFLMKAYADFMMLVSKVECSWVFCW
jgi:hypothetical protein